MLQVFHQGTGATENPYSGVGVGFYGERGDVLIVTDKSSTGVGATEHPYKGEGTPQPALVLARAKLGAIATATSA